MNARFLIALDADGELVEPDGHWGRVGLDTGGQPICLPRVGCV